MDYSGEPWRPHQVKRLGVYNELQNTEIHGTYFGDNMSRGIFTKVFVSQMETSNFLFLPKVF